MTVVVVEHPIVADRLARIRDRMTPTSIFRRLVEEVGLFLAYEATRTLCVRDQAIETPVAPATVARVAERPIVAPILRAGLGLLPGFLHVVDDADVAHVGFYRDPDTLVAIPYYANLPDSLAGRPVYVLDPMLATGHSGVAALTLLAERGARDATFISLIASTIGITTLQAAHTGVRIVTAAIDDTLTARGYISPGLGDAGDRMFGSATSLPVGDRRR